MPTELLIAIVTSTTAAVSSITCAYIANKSAKKQDAQSKDNKEYRAQREKLDKANSNALLASLEGVLVLLHQAKGEKLNGNVEMAMDAAEDAKKELSNIRSEIAAQV